MKATRLVLFVLAFLCFGAQEVRHVYVRWFEPTRSVLDKYAAPVRADIREAQALPQLEALYAAELKKTSGQPQRRADMPMLVDEGAPGTARPVVVQLREAIEQWEAHEKEIRELRFFYFAGFIALVFAWLLYKPLPWASLGLTILGFSDMLWATCPSWRSGPAAEFQRLLENKLFFSLIAIALIVLFRWRGPLSTPKSSPGAPA